MMDDYLPHSYIYLNAFMLAFGVWAMAAPDNTEPVLMFIIINLGSIVTDIVFLAVFTPQPYHGNYSLHNFCLAMAIINLLARPFTSFVLYRIYQDRGGQYADFTVPGMPNFGMGGGRQTHGYENIDQPIPSNNVETASPHHSIDGKSPIP